MSYRETIEREINLHLDKLEKAGKSLHATWITHEICNKHKSGLAETEDADFWRYGGYRITRDLSRRCINKRLGVDPDQKPLEQMRLPGFDHLQRYYLVKRNGDEIGVPIDEMTDQEIVEKATRFRAMSAACNAHAAELVRYQRQRKRA